MVEDWKKILIEALTKAKTIDKNWNGEIRISISEGGIRWIDISQRRK